MRSRIRPAWYVAFALAVVASACSGGPSADEYFTNLEGVSSTLGSELDDLEGEFNAGLLDIDFASPGSERQLIDLFQASITRTTASFALLVTGIEELDPPSDLAAPHQEAIDAGQRVLAEYQERAEQLQTIDTLADIDAYAEAFSASGVRVRFTESCRELQAIADREGIDADLGCS